MNAAEYAIYSDAAYKRVEARENLKNKHSNKSKCCCSCNYDNRHPEIIKQAQAHIERQKQIFESIYGGISQPLSYNQKVFELAKELRTEELKKQIYNVEYIISNVYSKAESAIQDRFIIHKDMFSLAQDIEYFKNSVVDDTKLIHNIILQADLHEELHIIKQEYLKYYNLK